MKRKFEEEAVETPAEEVVEESTPDSHEQFINILVEMGLSAEQAEAVHEMAMKLVENGTSEETTEETKVEASRQRRAEFARRKRRGYARRGRMMSEERAPQGRREMSREERRMRRLARENRMLRQQLSELGQQPASQPLRNRPEAKAAQPTIEAGGSAKSRVFDYFKDVI
jgi:hypothetical protein